MFLFSPKENFMDSRFLKSLITIVENGSIADAARIEGMTAAAVSQRIQVLERQFGFPLLLRLGNSAKPTEACLALLPRAKTIVREVEALAGDADSAGLTGSYRIGAISTALTGTMPKVLRSLAVKAPQVRAIIHPGTSHRIFESLLAGELDAAIVVAPSFALPKTLRSVSLFTEELVLLSREDPTDGIESYLLAQPYLRYDPHSWGGMLGEKYIKDKGLRLTSRMDLDGLEAIALLVSDGMGVSLVPHWRGLERLADGCKITPVSEAGYAREIVLLTHVQSQRPGMDEALKIALSECRWGHKHQQYCPV